MLLVQIACNKAKDAPALIDKIVLNELEDFEDSVKLTWSGLNNVGFNEYIIYRWADQISDPFYADVIARIEDVNVTSFIDNEPPHTTNLEYQVVGLRWLEDPIFSNKQELIRNDIVNLEISPFDMLHDKNQNLIYFIEESGIISIYDYSIDKIIKTIDTQAELGYSALGFHNNKNELYVPRNDGFVFIYDANTLQKIDQIDVGLYASSVVYNDGKLFISNGNALSKVFDRDTKSILEYFGDNRSTRLKLIPNSNTEIVEITLYIHSPTEIDYYSFDESGQEINHINDRYNGDYPLDAKIFNIFPSGSKIITSKKGAIYTKSLTYESSLPPSNFVFSSFAFSNDNNYILGGHTDNKSIEKFSTTDYTHQGSYETVGFSLQLFVNDKIISVSKPLETWQGKIFIEKIEF